MSRLGFSITVAFMLITSACSTNKKSTEETPAASGGDGGTVLVAADLAGTHFGACQNITTNAYGNTLNGWSMLPAIYFSAAGNYHIDMAFYTAANCQFGAGNEAFAYTSFGAFSLATSNVAGMTPIVFVSGGANNTIVTMYAGSNASGATWAGYFNADCTSNPGFSVVANGWKDVAGNTCTHSGAPDFTFAQFPANSTTWYNLIGLDSVSSPTTVTITLPDNIWAPGLAAGFPTTAGSYTFAF